MNPRPFGSLSSGTERRDPTLSRREPSSRHLLALPALNVAAVLELPVQVKEPDIPLLRRRLCILLGRAGPRPVVCDAGRLTYPNIVAVDALARLQLTATRRGARIAVARSSPELRELLALTGLGDVLLLCGDHRSR